MFGYLEKIGRWLSVWIQGARLRTLPAAFLPVLVGTGIASRDLLWGRFGLALATSVCLQVGVNYANDYSDGKRGTDSPAIRKGPPRLTGGGIKSPGAVLSAALLFFSGAGVCGFILAALTSWWVLGFGALALLAAWGYTGKPLAYGYKPLGEVSVVLFFGFFAVAGSAYIQDQSFSVILRTREVWLCGAGMGLVSAGVLIANNYRDIENDRLAKKNTLAVLMGENKTLNIYGAVLWAAGLLALSQIGSTALVLLGLVGPALGILLLLQSATPKLGNAILALLGYGAGLSAAYWASPVL